MKVEQEQVRSQRRDRFKVEPSSLPDDPAALKAKLQELATEGLALCAKLEHAEDSLHLELLRRFGGRCERYPFLNPDQKTLFDELEGAVPPKAAEETEEEEPKKNESARPRRRKKPNGRRPIPPELRREEVVLDLDPEDRRCPCCNEIMVEFDREISERLEYKPAELYAVRKIRPKYACTTAGCSEGILTVELPPEPIKRGLPGAGLLAYLLVAKFADHLPLYRLQGILGRSGVEIARSTLCDWVRACADLLTPLYAHFHREILGALSINADETTMPCLDPEERGPGATKRRNKDKKERKRGDPARKGYTWLYYGSDDRPYTVYHYRPNRTRAGPLDFLEGFSGYLLTDDYDGYDEACTRYGITRLACWAHVRRKFYEARTNDRARSQAALDFIGELYQIERELHGATPEERKQARIERARPVLDRIKAWLDAEKPNTLPKSPIGRAVRYAHNLWPRLEVYLDDGRLPIDNNVAERAIKPIVIGRKNWLFTGSDDGGRRAAVICTIIETCRRHGVEPFAYLRHLLATLPAYRGDLADLTPLAWKAGNEQAGQAEGSAN